MQADRFNGRALNNVNNFIGLTGQYVEIENAEGSGLGYYRTIVREQDAEAMTVELQNNYSEKAFMSWDGLFRPISMSRQSGLPQYAYCEIFEDCAGCSGVSPNTFLLTIEDVTAASGLTDINGIYSLSRISGCKWSYDAARDISIYYNGSAWILEIDGETSSPSSGVVSCVDSNNPIPFVWSGGQPSGYTGGSYSAAGFNALTIYDLQPWQNPSGLLWDHVAANRSDTKQVGHDLEVAARSGTARGETPDGGLGMYQAAIAQGSGFSSLDHRDNYRVMAHKGPMVVHGWGYDTNNRPVPNLGDSETAASTGNFTKDGLDDNKFLEGHLRKPNTWPVGPVDLRWDRNKCVWNIFSDSVTALSAAVAAPSGGASTSGLASKDCFCAIINSLETVVNILDKNNDITTGEAETLASGITNARDVCGCPSGTEYILCPGCLEGSVPTELEVTITGITYVPWNGSAFRPNYDNASPTLLSYFNKTHIIPMNCTLGNPGGQIDFNVEAEDDSGDPWITTCSISLVMISRPSGGGYDTWRISGSVWTDPGGSAQTDELYGENLSESCYQEYSTFVRDSPPFGGNRFLDWSSATATVRIP